MAAAAVVVAAAAAFKYTVTAGVPEPAAAIVSVEKSTLGTVIVVAMVVTVLETASGGRASEADGLPDPAAAVAVQGTVTTD